MIPKAAPGLGGLCIFIEIAHEILKLASLSNHLSSVLKTPDLTVYTAPWCRDCHTAKRWLAQHHIPYTEINIEEVPGAAEEVIQRTGKRAIPQFVLDGKWIQPYVPGRGFRYREMAELFGVEQSGI